jgi:simple sugar transport system permease protein
MSQPAGCRYKINEGEAMTTGENTGKSVQGQLLRRPEAGTLLGLLLVYFVFAILGGANFMGAAGLSSWMNVAAEVGIIALPVGLLMIAGHLDISVGSIVPASSLTVALIANHYEMPIILGIAGGLCVGMLIGYINGFLVTRTTIPSLIITIGTMFGTMGLALGLTVLIKGSTGVFLVADPLTKSILGQAIGGMFRVSIFWWLGLAAVFYFLLHLSPWGNAVFALGGDRESARRAGVATQKLTIQLYMLSGLAAAFVGVIQIIANSNAQVAAGSTFIFNSIMCVAIGGVSLIGGAGSVIGIVLGTIIFAVVTQGVFYSGLDTNLVSIVIGGMFLLAVLTNDSFRTFAQNFAAKTK